MTFSESVTVKRGPGETAPGHAATATHHFKLEEFLSGRRLITLSFEAPRSQTNSPRTLRYVAHDILLSQQFFEVQQEFSIQHSAYALNDEQEHLPVSITGQFRP